MSATLYRSMLSKVKALLKVESGQTLEERKSQQWQLLFDIDNTKFIVGKGGANTMFYTVGDKERVLCYPDELLSFLSKFVEHKHSTYAIYSDKGRPITTGILSEDEALKLTAPVGYYIVAMENAKKKRLYVRKSGVFEHVWQPFKPKIRR